MFEQIAHSRLALVLLAALLACASAAFFMGRRKAVAAAGGASRNLHSRPNYYGYFVALWALLPALAVLALYAAAGNTLADHLAAGQMSPELARLPAYELAMQVDRARAVASGPVSWPWAAASPTSPRPT
jgi:phosphate transport system permease protein